MHSLPKIPEMEEEDLIKIESTRPPLQQLFFLDRHNLWFDVFFGENFLIAPISFSPDEKEI